MKHPPVYLLTLTGGRPAAFEYCKHFVSRWESQFDHWFVISDTPWQPLELPTFATQVQPAQESAPGGASTFLANLQHLLSVCPRDGLLVFVEDDDCYGPHYLENLVRAVRLEPGADLVGFPTSLYYNLEHQCWRIFRNKQHCSLAQSALCTPLALSQARRLVDSWQGTERYDVDVALWSNSLLKRRQLAFYGGMVGIKSMPGRKGLGVGHNPRNGWQQDDCCSMLRSWLGVSDVQLYLPFVGYENAPSDLPHHANGKLALESPAAEIARATIHRVETGCGVPG